MRKIVILSDRIESNPGFIELLSRLFHGCEISIVSPKVKGVEKCSTNSSSEFHFGDVKVSETDE